VICALLPLIFKTRSAILLSGPMLMQDTVREASYSCLKN
jgi:hypothetical protein